MQISESFELGLIGNIMTMTFIGKNKNNYNSAQKLTVTH